VPVRWGWIIGCIMLGLAGIAAGLLLVPDRTTYVANVLAGIGTTLLLVGIVVLLERRIVGTAAKAVRRAVDAEREASDARIDRLSVILKIGYLRSGLEPMRRMWMP
jgi:hypothetical protein